MQVLCLGHNYVNLESLPFGWQNRSNTSDISFLLYYACKFKIPTFCVAKLSKQFCYITLVIHEFKTPTFCVAKVGRTFCKVCSLPLMRVKSRSLPFLWQNWAKNFAMLLLYYKSGPDRGKLHLYCNIYIVLVFVSSNLILN